MTRDPVTVRATTTVAGFLAEGPFDAYRHSTFPVLAADGTPTGLVTVGLINRVPPQDRSATTVADVARPLADVATTVPDEPVVDLLPRLDANRDRRALFLDTGHLVGIVTLADVSRALSWLTATTRPRT
ncbi:CBS domain-containing protein [Streptomyces sp. NBC_00996]|uniref:CBS domain-containing protein n=1 Tax=Streptomyces sp. NBC_00996 TaxID=2903710 RepID=UPI00386E6747|nr:CBS domain-containing protein [Streptomyces sp. NBC_00996]